MQPTSMVNQPCLAQPVRLRCVGLTASAVWSCPLAKSAMWSYSLHLNTALFLMLPWMSAEFLSGLNPLETLRRYLDDRFKRRQRKDREPLEQRRLQLENMERENQVMLGVHSRGL
jgi:hypothetical protein